MPRKNARPAARKYRQKILDRLASPRPALLRKVEWDPFDATASAPLGLALGFAALKALARQQREG